MSALRHHVATLLLPTVVFGFAVYSNTSLLLRSGTTVQTAQIEALSISGMLDGEVTEGLDSLYKSKLPHRDVAVGLGGNARYSVFGTGRKGVVVGTDGWLFTNEEFKEIASSDISDAVRQIIGVKKRLETLGIALLVLPLPAKSDVYKERLSERMKSDDMALAYSEFLSGLAKAGIRTVDTKSTFLSHKDEVDVFLKSDTHWSPAGAQLASEAVSGSVGKLGTLLEPGAVTVVPEEPVELWGDLTKFVTLPEYASGIGFKPENVKLFRTQMGAAQNTLDLFGSDTSAPVMLVGTSYSANENWSFVDYLRQSLSVDVVNVAKEGLGPGVPMMELLSGDTLAEGRPKIIVWEFPVRYLGGPNLWERRAQPDQGHGSQVTGKSNV